MKLRKRPLLSRICNGYHIYRRLGMGRFASLRWALFINRHVSAPAGSRAEKSSGDIRYV